MTYEVGQPILNGPFDEPETNCYIQRYSHIKETH